MKKIGTFLLLCIILLTTQAYASNRPEGTYALYLGNTPFYIITFNGDEVVKGREGEEQTHGTFAMDGNQINITYDDGGQDTFIYDSENDALDLMGTGYMLEKIDDDSLDRSADDNLIKMAIKNTKTLKSKLKAPDTIILKDDMHIIDAEEDGADYISTITYTAQNSFGVPIKGIAVFIDEEYLGEHDELEEYVDEEIDYSDLEAASKVATQHRIISGILLKISFSEIMGDYKIVSGGDVAKELGIEFKPD